MWLKKLLWSLSLICLCLGSFALAYDCEGVASSQVFDLWLEEEIYNSNWSTFQLMPYANFLYNSTDKVFRYGDSSNWFLVFWIDQNLYYIRFRTIWWSISAQWFFQYYTTVKLNNACRWNSYPMSNFYTTTWYNTPDYFSYTNDLYRWFTPCFWYSDLDYSVCFQQSSEYLTWSLNFTVSDLDQLNSVFEDSPFTSYSVPDSEIIYIYPGLTWTNLDYYNAFLERWYYKWLCYSDFYTWSLIDSWTLIPDLFVGDLDDSTYYWHSVYDFYSWSNTSLSTHSRSQQRYALMKYTYERNDLTPYIWFQKGTRNIMFNIYNNHFNDNFSWIDYRTFCDMTVNWFNDNEIFDGDVSQSMKDYTQRLEDEKQFVLSGADEDFSGADWLLWLFNWLYSRFKTAFPVDPNLSSKETWILPSYIILAFFLFLLLYVLKR